MYIYVYVFSLAQTRFEHIEHTEDDQMGITATCVNATCRPITILVREGVSF